MNEQEVFIEALQKGSLEQRESFLDKVCGHDAGLRQRVEALLAAHEQARSFMADPAAEIQAAVDKDSPQSDPAVGESGQSTASADTEGLGTIIGPYKLLQKIGEGGMGTVYMAEQCEPVRRKVALKIIKPGMDTAQVIARFEAERQALALMEHPHIAKVLDAGSLDTGRPYFVMELVKGVPITQYCDQQRLTPQERLSLFVPVCQAIQHAHQKGIIHRDIKPSNVLIASFDGRPVVKVIDFGVAKAIGQQLTERTLFTGFGGIVGTLEYMAPEQAEFNALDIDTRSDIYALGVLLYELLTGTTPLTRRRLKQAAITEVLRVIREEEPPRPSTRLSESRDSLVSISAVRRMEPARLTKLVRGEVDWIVMKALEKDRTRRYATAIGLARDIERFLHDEAVEACPPSATYKLRKFAGRHRKVLGAAAAFSLLIVVGAVTSTLLAVRATRAERLAAAHLIDVQVALSEKQRSLEQAEAVADFLVEAFRNPDPTAAGQDVTVAEMLDQATARLADRFTDHPEIRSNLLDALGQTYTGLSPTEEAVRLLDQSHAIRRREFGSGDPRTVRTLGHLAFAVYLAGNVDRAIQLGQEAVKRCRVAWQPDDRESPLHELLINLSLFYSAAAKPETDILPLGREALQRARAIRGDDHPDTALAMWNLARLHADAGRYDEALPLAQAAARIFEAKLGKDHPNTIRALIVEGHATFGRSGDWSDALPFFEELHQRAQRRFGKDHHMVHELVLGYLSYAYLFRRQYSEVVEHVEPALQRYEASQGEDHFVAIRALVVLARAHTHLGNFKKALSLGRKALVTAKHKFGVDHAKTQAIADELFRLGYSSVTDTFSGEESIALTRPALEQAEELFGPDHGVTFLATMTLASCYVQTARHEEAEPVLRKAVERARRVLPADHEFLLTALTWFGKNQMELGKHVEAEALYREVLDAREKKTPNTWQVYQTMSLLGECLLAQKRFAEAEPQLIDGYEGMKQRKGKIPESVRKTRLTEALRQLVRFYEARQGDGDVEKSARWKAALEELQASRSSEPPVTPPKASGKDLPPPNPSGR